MIVEKTSYAIFRKRLVSPEETEAGKSGIKTGNASRFRSLRSGGKKNELL